MYVKCEICHGSGKVDKNFGMGKCKEIPDDPFNRVCPGCNGSGMQYRREVSQSNPIYIKPCKPFEFPSDPYKKERKDHIRIIHQLQNGERMILGVEI